MKLLLALLTGSAVVGAASVTDPVVRFPGSASYTGLHLPTFDQDAFLGIRYAKQPVRFAPSRLASASKEGAVKAKEYGTSCPAYGADTTRLVELGITTLGEDCLNLNVVRPAGKRGPLPVLVWIYGGGWQQGSTADPRYNVSYIVQQSVEIGKPIVAVSLNHRTAGFGFLFSQEIMNSGNANLGLRDQRVALQWIQKNIRAFGGDPKKVTIMGESAGAYSVGNHLLAYGGRDDGLFRAAILQSGTAVGPPLNDTRWYQPLYNRVTSAVGCENAIDTLQCLRTVPYDDLYPALNIGLEWFAAVDGDLIRSWPTVATHQKRFIKVPLLLGTNTDEGTSFGVTGVNTDAEAVAQLTSSKRWTLTTHQAATILALYPDNPALGSPYGTGNRTWPGLGVQYKRYSSLAGDLTMEAPRRLLAESAVAVGVSAVYSYRFDAPLQNETARVGVGHFQDVPHVFANTDTAIPMTPVLGDDLGRVELARMMARMWCAFVSELDPNGHEIAGMARWPKYSLERPRNFVFRRPREESYVEADSYRMQAMRWINGLLR